MLGLGQDVVLLATVGGVGVAHQAQCFNRIESSVDS